MFDNSMKNIKEFIPPTLLLLVSTWYQSLRVEFKGNWGGISRRRKRVVEVFFRNTYLKGEWGVTAPIGVTARYRQTKPSSSVAKKESV